MNRPVIILGGGGHAKVLIEVLKLLEVRILGATDPHVTPGTKLHHNVEIVGADDVVMNYSSDDVYLVNGIGPAYGNTLRQRLGEKFRNLTYKFPPVIHPNTQISAEVCIDDGAQIMAGSIIQPGSSVGVMSVINTGAIIDHDCQIGNDVHVAPGVVICGSVAIKTGCFIGAGAVVLPNLTLGSGAIVGAGTTLRVNLQSNETYYGRNIYNGY